MVRKALYYLTHWEVWHWFIKYIIIGPAWLRLCIKARTPWFFSPSNPTITFGGFLGETKREVYSELPPSSYPKSIFISPKSPYYKLECSVIAAGFRFPFVVKPDVGMMGLMVRKIESFRELRQYHAAMKVDYIVQEYSDYPLEVSVFYYRYPSEKKGRITGFVRKECMKVVGDGKSTLKELILAYPRARFRTKELFGKHRPSLDTIIPEGESFILSDALNLSRGGLLIDLSSKKDEQLLAVFDKLSHYSGKLFYGRYDIKCASIEDLKKGRNFTILEFNGCGGEPHHVYANGNSFSRACRILIDHWNVLYKISEQGKRPWGLIEGWKFLRKAQIHFKQLKKLDHSFAFIKEGSVKRSKETIILHGNQLQHHAA